MSFLRKAVLVNSTQFICLGIGVLQTAILSRVLGPAGIGQYAVILSALMLAVQFSSLGFPMSFLYHSRHDPGNTNTYRINAVWVMLLLGTIGGIATALIINFNPAYFGEVSGVVLIGVVVYIPVVLQSVITRNNLMIAIEAKRLSLMQLAVAVIGAGLVLLLYAIGSLGVSQALFCFFAMAATCLLFGAYWMRKDVDFSVLPKWKTSAKLGLMGIRLSSTDLMVLVNGQLNILIIKYLIDNFESVGFFSRGQRVAMLAVTAGSAVMPLLFSRWAAIKKEQLSRHVEKVMRFASTVAIIMIFAILLLGKWIILILYGKQFLPALVPMMILLPGTVLYLVSSALIRLLGSRGKPEIAALMLFCGAIINAGLSWVLIPTIGINGAAIAATTGYTALLVSLMVTVKIRFKVRVLHCVGLTINDIKAIGKSLRHKDSALS